MSDKLHDEVEKERWAFHCRVEEECGSFGYFNSGHEARSTLSLSNSTEESRQLDLKHSKDSRPLPKSDKESYRKEFDCTEFDKETIKVFVRGKSIFVQGTKKSQLGETTLTFDPPDQCDLDRVEAGFHSNDILYVRFFSRNEADV